MPKPNELVSPNPIQGNSGNLMCPFTSDGTVAPWMNKAYTARFGAAIGKAVGAYAGKKAAEQVTGMIPFVGGYLGDKAGEAIGREAALAACGGRDFIKQTSDQSFNEVDDLAVFMYVNYSTRPDYPKIYQLTCDVYPKLEKNYTKALQKAPRK
jgi:hypothetical protein